jgi:hypothetical protein
MKFTWHGGHAKTGISPPGLDGHGRPLINPAFVDASSPQAGFVVVADRPFTLNHKNHRLGINWICDWLCSYGPSVRVLDRELLPPGVDVGARNWEEPDAPNSVKIGVGIEFPAKKKTEAKR